MNADLASISAILAKEESLEWASRPEPFETVDATNKKALIRRWLLCAVVGIALIVIYIIAASKSDSAGITPIIPIVIAVVAIYIAVLPFLDARTIRRKKTFVLTNRRAILYESDSNLKSFPFENMDEVKIIRKGGNLCDVLFGSAAIKRPYYKIRLTALMPRESMKDADSFVRGMAFYNVTGADRIKSLIPEGLKITVSELSKEL